MVVIYQHVAEIIGGLFAAFYVLLLALYWVNREGERERGERDD